MIIKQDYSAMVIVLLIVIFMICGFGYLIGDRPPAPAFISPTTAPDSMLASGSTEVIESDPPLDVTSEETGAANIAANQDENEAAGTTATQIVAEAYAEATQIAGKKNEGQIADVTAGLRAEEDNNAHDRKVLFAILYGVIFFGASVDLILVITLIYLIRHNAYQKEQEKAAYQVEQQRINAELRAIQYALSAREGTVQPPAPAYTFRPEISTGKRWASRKLPLGG
ncbi:MAG: hypothetical protein ROW52_13505 [Anaerolineaceae bacterium]|jgi:hypothetical protein